MSQPNRPNNAHNNAPNLGEVLVTHVFAPAVLAVAQACIRLVQHNTEEREEDEGWVAVDRPFVEEDDAAVAGKEDEESEVLERTPLKREEKEEEKERQEKEKMEREKKEKQARERQERERQEKETQEKEKQEMERQERERQERERREKKKREWERQEMERREKEKRKWERQERERQEREKQKREKQEREKQEREKQEREKQEREKQEREGASTRPGLQIPTAQGNTAVLHLVGVEFEAARVAPRKRGKGKGQGKIGSSYSHQTTDTSSSRVPSSSQAKPASHVKPQKQKSSKRTQSSDPSGSDSAGVTVEEYTGANFPFHLWNQPGGGQFNYLGINAAGQHVWQIKRRGPNGGTCTYSSR